MVLCLYITTCFWYSTLDIFILPRLELAGFLSSLEPHYYDYWQTSTQLTFSVDTGDPLLNPIVCTEIKIHRTISLVSNYLNVLKRLISMYPFCPQIICVCVCYMITGSLFGMKTAFGLPGIEVTARYDHFMLMNWRIRKLQ